MVKLNFKIMSCFIFAASIVYMLFNADSAGSSALCICSFALWCAAILFALSKKNVNRITVCFLITFFVFMLSRILVVYLKEKRLYTIFSETITKNTFLIISVALIGLFLGMMTDGITVKFSNTSFSLFNTSNINIKALRLSSALFTLLSGAALFLTEAEKALFYRSSDVLDGGALRVSYATSLPGVVLRLSYVYNLMFCIYLATLPEKKKCRWMFLLFIVIRAMKLIYGSRGDFVLCLMFAYIYYWMRDIKNKKSGETGEKWLGKAEKTLLVASIPAIIILMVFIGYYRTNTAFHFSGFFDTLYEFFFSQGVSIDVLGNTQKYINDFNQPHFLYMFDNTYQFLVTNPISKIITGKTYYAANTVERALYGTSLGQTLYYNINPQSYLAGNGCGSAYLAEAYLGYGIVGVFVINFLLERIINRISKAKSNNVASLTIRLLFILNLFFMPRSGFDVFIGDFTSVTHILALIMLWFLYKILSGKDFGDNYAETSQKG